MKIKLFTLLIVLVSITDSRAQDRTTVKANSVDISDNLDLRAIATIFGEAANLEDFEHRLNDPQTQISNLDLNNDNQVDYLRVIESVEGRTHLIIVQSVIGRDLFQDVATIEVEKDRNNKLQVQIVGDVYMYGTNYIYEPIYAYTPIIYNTFWVNSYRPYCSPWYWNYYPSYYFVWNPYPYFHYRNHINFYVNYNNTCHYVNHRRSSHAVAMHRNYRTNGYERQYPNRSFNHRNDGYYNRHELVQIRNYSSNRDKAVASSPRSTRANLYTGTSNSGLRNTTYNTSNVSNSPRPRAENPKSYSSESVYSSPKPRTENPKSYSNETVYSTPKPRVKNTNSSEYLAFNNPRSTTMNSSSSEYSSPKPRVEGVKEDNNFSSTPRITPKSSEYSSPRSTTNQASSPRVQNQNSYSNSPQPRATSSSKVEQTRSEGRNKNTAETRTSGNSIRRG
jgi:hypothetical protein